MKSVNTNEITGDTLISKVSSDSYRDGYDRIFSKKEEPVEDSPKNQIMLRNSGFCAICKEAIISKHRHDFVQCNCGGSFVDGGLTYQRCGGSLVDTSVYCDEDDIETIREYFTWKSYGKNGDEPAKFILLKDMSDDHCKAILETQWHIKGTQSEKNFKMELEYRKMNGIEILDK